MLFSVFSFSGGGMFHVKHSTSTPWQTHIPRPLSPLVLVRPAGFEPATYGFVVRYSIRLSYGRTHVFYHDPRERRRHFSFSRYFRHSRYDLLNYIRCRGMGHQGNPFHLTSSSLDQVGSDDLIFCPVRALDQDLGLEIFN